MLSPALIAKSLLVFAAAGLLEIAGGYGIWLWLRDARHLLFGLAGAAGLVLFGVALTALPTHFGRAYAAYGGVFVAMSLLWGWWVDGQRPDLWDTVGTAVVLTGVTLIMFAPRG